MKAKLSLYVTAIVLLAILTVGVGCTKAPNDAQLTSDIQNKLATDSGSAGQATRRESRRWNRHPDRHGGQRCSARSGGPLCRVRARGQAGHQQSAGGRSAASGDGAARRPPVEEAKPSPAPAPKPVGASLGCAACLVFVQRRPSPAAPVAAMTPPAPVAAVPPTPPPPPPPQKVTIPSGTTLAVRLVDTIDSETASRARLSTPRWIHRWPWMETWSFPPATTSKAIS